MQIKNVLLRKKVNYNNIITSTLLLNIILLLYENILADFYSQLTILNFLHDFFNIIVVVVIISKGKLNVGIRKISDILLLLFVIWSLISFVWGENDFILAFKRYRYIVSAIIMYATCKEFMDWKHFNTLDKVVSVSLIINTILVCYQGFIMQLHPDFCNGIFGFKDFNNAAEGMFCIIVSLLSVGEYFESGKFNKRIIFRLLLSAICCGVAEIKIYFAVLAIALVIIIVKAILSNKLLSVLKVMILISTVFVIAIKVMSSIMPENLSAFISVSNYIAYENYSNSLGNGIGRLNQISFITENEFHYNLLKIIVGNGVGTFTNNNIYELGQIYSNVGLIGIFFFFGFLITLSIERFFKKKKGKLYYFSFTYPIVVLIATILWNCTLNKMCFLVFALLSFDMQKVSNSSSRMKEIKL